MPDDPYAAIAQDDPYAAIAKGPEPNWLDKEIPLTSTGAAFEQGAQSLVRGGRDAILGVEHMVAHPIDTLRGIADIPSQAAQVPAAIHDINESVDPLGTYAKVGQETAGQGAGQAALALGTEGLVRGVGAGARAVKPIVGPALRTAGNIVDPDITGLWSPRLAHAQRVAGKIGEAMRPNTPVPPIETSPTFRIPEVRQPIPIRNPIKASDFAIPRTPEPPAPVMAKPTAEPAPIQVPKPAMETTPDVARADRLETSNIQDRIRNYAEGQDRQALEEVARERLSARMPRKADRPDLGNLAKTKQAAPVAAKASGTPADADLEKLLEDSLAKLKADRVKFGQLKGGR